jgi:hypothetical protein
MSSLSRTLKRSGLPVLLVLCLAALSVSYASADEVARPRALQIIGDPDAAVNGRFAVGTGSVGSKALTVVGVIDFLGAGTVHNYFTQGTGNNMQINTNVDEANAVGDASRSQWKLVLGSSLDWFSIRRSPAGGTYNEDALFFIQGSTGNVGIATVDTNNGATIPFTPAARLHVQTASGDAILGQSSSPSGRGVLGYALATSGTNYGVWGQAYSSAGTGILGVATATTGTTYGVYGRSDSTSGSGVLGSATAETGTNYGVFGASASTSGRGVYGYATTTTGTNYGVFGETQSDAGYGVYGRAWATTGTAIAVYGVSNSPSGYGVYGVGNATTGTSFGVRGWSNSPSGTGVQGYAWSTTGTNYGVYGYAGSPSGYGVYFSGGLAGTGTKSAIVETQDHGWRTLYTIESPQNWFEDFGQGTLAGGEAVVAIEPIFAQTVNLEQPYHVFLTPLGNCGLYVAEQTATSFTVRALNGAACDVGFHYRIIAPRLDYEDLRLEPAEDPEAVAAAAPPAAPEIE